MILADGQMDRMIAFISATYGSINPKSVSKLISGTTPDAVVLLPLSIRQSPRLCSDDLMSLTYAEKMDQICLDKDRLDKRPIPVLWKILSAEC